MCTSTHKPTTIDTGEPSRIRRVRREKQIKTRKKETLMCPFSVHEGEVKKQNQPMAPQKKRNDLFKRGNPEESPIANERRRNTRERKAREGERKRTGKQCSDQKRKIKIIRKRSDPLRGLQPQENRGAAKQNAVHECPAGKRLAQTQLSSRDRAGGDRGALDQREGCRV